MQSWKSALCDFTLNMLKGIKGTSTNLKPKAALAWGCKHRAKDTVHILFFIQEFFFYGSLNLVGFLLIGGAMKNKDETKWGTMCDLGITCRPKQTSKSGVISRLRMPASFPSESWISTSISLPQMCSFLLCWHSHGLRRFKGGGRERGRKKVERGINQSHCKVEGREKKQQQIKIFSQRIMRRGNTP